MPKIAVTGATGNLGGMVIDHLLALGVSPQDVVPIARSAEKGAPFADRHMSPRIASYDDPAAFRIALEGIDKLVLISSPCLDNAVRLSQLHAAVMAAHDAKVSQLAFVSLADPEERPFGLEDIELAIEHSIRAIGIPFTFLRNSVYLDELGSELVAAVKTGELVSATNNHAMNWAPRADQAAAIAAAVTQEGHLGATYNLVSPRPYTYEDVAAWLGEASGQPISHRSVAPEEAIEALASGGLPQSRAESIVRYFQKAIADGKCRTTGDDIERLSGRPGHPTPDYLGKLIERASR